MAEKQAVSKPDKASRASREGAAEKSWRFLRNINALGAAAVGAVALAIPGPNILLASYAGFNAAQAGGFELLRQHSRKKRVRKEVK